MGIQNTKKVQEKSNYKRSFKK